MKKALISPNEFAGAGVRIAQVENEEFHVAEPLFWVDCNDDITAENYYYDESTNQIKEIERQNISSSTNDVENMIAMLLSS